MNNYNDDSRGERNGLTIPESENIKGRIVDLSSQVAYYKERNATIARERRSLILQAIKLNLFKRKAMFQAIEQILKANPYINVQKQQEEIYEQKMKLLESYWN